MRTLKKPLILLAIATVFPCAAIGSSQDVTLEPIAADEPIVPAGFPPIPDRLDVGAAGSWSAAAAGSSQSALAAPSGPIRPTYHQHYGHVPAGAYLPSQARRRYPTTGDMYASNAAQSLGPEPRLNGRADQASTPAAPAAVSVSQSTTQDLSLPDDEFAGRPRRYNYIGRTAGYMVRSAVWRAAGTGMMYGGYGLRF